MEVTRRGLLIGAAAGGGLLIAYGLRSRSHGPPLAPGRGEVAFDAWIKLASDGVVSVAVPQLEMGQGVSTLLPQIVAMEMGADWRQIAVEPAPISGAYANVPLAARWAPLWMPLAPGLADAPDSWLASRFAENRHFMVTAEGTSLAAYEGPLRAAAASARSLLAMAAADRWNVAWEECEAAGGFIIHEDKRLRFAELAAEAAGHSPPDPPPLRSVPPMESLKDEPLEGLPNFPRLDGPSKVDGSYLFAGDIRLPGMVYAAIRHGPVGMAELVDFERGRKLGLKGLVGIVNGKRWLAAVADSWWTADKALQHLAPAFKVEKAPNSAMIEEALDKGVRHGGTQRLVARGDGDDRMGKPSLALRYDVAPAVHATLETSSATAHFRDGKLELWIGSQAPAQARAIVADALSMSAGDVVLYPMPAGGSFDRRLDNDHAIEAALIAREVGKPVQLIWSRWQEMLASRPRTPVAAVLSAKVAQDGSIDAFRARLALPATAKEFGRRMFGKATSWAAIEQSADEADPMALEGMEPTYGIPNVAVDHVPVTIHLPTGRMRGNAHGYTAFFLESFIDELAHRHRREPLSYRMAMLGGDLRLAGCLQRVARLAQWGGGAEQSGQGLACHRIGEGCIAAVATAVRAEGGVRVEKVAAAVDIGRIVNIDLARQQIEGGLVFGLGLALGASVSYAKGEPTTAGLAALNLPLLADSPQIDVAFMASEADPVDPGELGVAVIAPAVANALFSASGLRLRRLPLLSEGL